VDLPDFDKESVAQIQILCTFQARGAPACCVPAEKPAQLAMYLPRNPRTRKPSVLAHTHKKSPDAAQ